MFKNPVMVSRYPILAKHKQGLGLEMPLNIIAGLARSDRATIFDRKVFIKGFSTTLIAIKITKDLLLWHYFYNVDGERLAYLDHSVQAVTILACSSWTLLGILLVGAQTVCTTLVSVSDRNWLQHFANTEQERQMRDSTSRELDFHDLTPAAFLRKCPYLQAKLSQKGSHLRFLLRISLHILRVIATSLNLSG
jgi:hypothetical protein